LRQALTKALKRAGGIAAGMAGAGCQYHRGPSWRSWNTSWHSPPRKAVPSATPSRLPPRWHRHNLGIRRRIRAESSGGGTDDAPDRDHPSRAAVVPRRPVQSPRAPQHDLVDCHPNVGKVPDATNVFLPDMSPLAAGPGAAGQSCVDCHHPPTSRGRGAPASCVTCHNYHDHGRKSTRRASKAHCQRLRPPPPPDGAAEPAGTESGAEPSPDPLSSQ
jgi:hypothetical protein